MPEQAQPNVLVQEPQTFMNRVADRLRPVLYLGAAGALALAGCSSDSENSQPDEVAAVETIVGPTEACPETWEVVQIDPGDRNRFLAEGHQKIAELESNEEAPEAFADWFNVVKQDPELLAGVLNGVKSTTYTSEQFQDKDGVCITEEAEQAATEFEASVLLGGAVVKEDAPEVAYNSGTDENGEVVTASQAGISGDRKAIKVTTAQGEVFWVMARCGNIVTEAQPGLPVGPTDEDHQEAPQPEGGKDHRKSPISDNRNHPDERVRPNIPAPEEVIRPENPNPEQPGPPPTIETPPEVQNPEPINPGVPELPPTPVDPIEECGDKNGDGIPDANC